MNETAKSSALEYLQIFFRRKKLFFLSLVIVPLVVFNVSNFLPKKYSTDTTIKINNEKILDPLISDLAVSISYKQRLQTIKEEILTWDNLANIAAELGINKDIYSQAEYERLILDLRKHIIVEMIGKDLVKITYVGTEPMQVKRVVDKISDLFIQKNLSSQNKEADVATRFITDQLEIYQKKLDESESIYSLYQTTNDLEAAKKQQQFIVKQMKKQPKEIVSRRERKENPLVGELKVTLIDLEVQLGSLLVDSTENHPKVKELRNEIVKTKQQLAKSIQEPQSIETRTINPVHQNLEQELKDIRFKIDTLKRTQEELKALNNNYAPKTLPQQELSSLARDKRVNEQIYGKLLERLEMANITKRLEASKRKTTFTVIEKARLPIKPFSPDTMRVALCSVIFGVMTGICLMILAEFVDNSFKGINEAKECLALPVLGAIPTIVTREDLTKSKANIAFSAVLFIIIFFLAGIGTYLYIR